MTAATGHEPVHHSGAPGAPTWSLSGLVAAGGSSARAAELEQLQGGSHDPRKNGFTIQALALAAHAELDAHLDATAGVVFHVEPNGENVTELEQAYIRYRRPPRGLTAIAGQFFVGFGEENQRHPDDWDFVDVPFALTRLFGADKLRTQGLQVTWAAPLPWSSSFQFGAYNPNGEAATSFLFTPGETLAGHVLQKRDVDAVGDLLYLLRWSHRLGASSGQRLGMGISALFGPNASGRNTNTQIYGLDLHWTRYRPHTSQTPVLDWRTEVMWRRYEAADTQDPNHETLLDYGAFTQAVWQIKEQWSSALRAELGDGNRNSGDDPFRGNRKRLSLNLTHRYSSAVKIRMQYNQDWADYLRDGRASSVWLQLVYQAGTHTEH